MWQPFLNAGAITFVTLLPLLSPVGAVAIFYALTAGETAAFRRSQARRTGVAMAVILILFLLVGDAVLRTFGITTAALRIAGGLVVGFTGWGMLTNSATLRPEERTAAAKKADISLVPMAFPLLAGPGAIGALMALASEFKGPASYAGAAVACLLLSALMYILLELGQPLVNMLGEAGLGAISRILGFFILAIGVDLIVLGVTALQH